MSKVWLVPYPSKQVSKDSFLMGLYAYINGGVGRLADVTIDF